MDWDDMRIFLAVAGADSLSAAGGGWIDASTVGRRVARLEQALGAKLFVKTPQGYALAPRGRAPAAPCRGRRGRLRPAPPRCCRVPATSAGSCASVPRTAVRTICCHRSAPASARRIRGWKSRSSRCPASSTCPGARRTWRLRVSQPRAGRLVVQRLTDYNLHLAAHEDYLRAMPRSRCPPICAAIALIGYIPDMIFDRELDYLAETGMGSRSRPRIRFRCRCRRRLRGGAGDRA